MVNAILLPIKPKFADLIIQGSKSIELRRSAPAQQINTIAIYSSSPIQSIVALVDVAKVIEMTPANLWLIAKKNGAGLTRTEFFDYFQSKNSGFAFMLKNIRTFKKPVDPYVFFESFTAPQSFKYITNRDLAKLEKILDKQR